MEVAGTTFSRNAIHELLRECGINPDSRVGSLVFAINFERMPGVAMDVDFDIRPTESVFVETKHAVKICPLVFGIAVELMDAEGLPALTAVNRAVIQLNHNQGQSSAA